MASERTVKKQKVIIPSKVEAFNWSRGSCKPCNLTLDAPTRKRLEDLCKEHKTSKSAIVRCAIDVLSK